MARLPRLMLAGQAHHLGLHQPETEREHDAEEDDEGESAAQQRRRGVQPVNQITQSLLFTRYNCAIL